MEIQTRRHILEIWRATVDYSYRDGKWTWGGRSGRNSISDAEQLLTILYPATAIDSLKIDRSTRRPTTCSTTCARSATHWTSRAG